MKCVHRTQKINQVNQLFFNHLNSPGKFFYKNNCQNVWYTDKREAESTSTTAK